MSKQKVKILVAMSGGVDSSVAVALLLEAGYDVTGAYMKQWDDKDETGVCTWKQDRRDALRVSAHLGIPLLTLDFEQEYKKWVMEYMYAEYERGRTPNPDVLCNKFIKFGVWLEKAKELGFAKLATGHYGSIETFKHKNIQTYNLLRAKDENKDQTYFLHQLTQEQLKYTLFPLGKYTKDEVRVMAKKFNLPNADRSESMGICFVGVVPMKDFLLKKIKVNKGNIVTSDGEVVGEHDGLAFYTIGQRHGFDIRNKNKIIESKAMYVVQKKYDTNELVVGFDDDELLYSKQAEIEDVNWISGQKPSFPLKCKVRLRHRQPLQDVQLLQKDGKILVEFNIKQKAVTPGQFAVFYQNQVCLGGGAIK
ncbi:MAG: tRNA 2-thiouridine(34) synthase MnmA [Candidatus Magasanikbacteria bacterium RIFCSPHIGHO2_01_FULL_33_34]|uniref:tRNA-specific 2-thiouridylase MnmA n=1 Tax=Candidatus Magasanikbacteria bacterium RIFCSPHIGHO2_01_FULL_33_34 TaxID=1798671 RepID=A0A1F6LL15_9BACT|nr:MAG: tRNA 2-thiouridine(34) synthase MnmA [Candidatus Magasanikbacteria bacterium RIFCSPHIGHO2_01_FULL_33_34]OGH65815.1 MAG: tRNA 2-thiouridine(34) synthase MnmA [Candidatus Magasanikbacteria bacterium RIFCSPHIGHO2_02_FULL_33_17]OGH75180.1 MAG: tRNA 2-thiouridine(34) synthase MnmA [Candidatus Magasanikbacteria bacterium RIFCSPLOWO2_01_FULL_33_34]